MTHQTYQLPPDGISQPPVGTGIFRRRAARRGFMAARKNAQPSGGQMSGSEGVSAADGMPAVYPGMDGGGYGSQMPRNLAQSQRMRNPVDMEGTHSPANPRQALQSSLMGLLSRNVGYFLMVTCLLGDRQAVTWQGILHSVGKDYIVLYQRTMSDTCPAIWAPSSLFSSTTPRASPTAPGPGPGRARWAGKDRQRSLRLSAEGALLYILD